MAHGSKIKQSMIDDYAELCRRFAVDEPTDVDAKSLQEVLELLEKTPVEFEADVAARRRIDQLGREIKELESQQNGRRDPAKD
jgi:hypothetical protein